MKRLPLFLLLLAWPARAAMTCDPAVITSQTELVTVTLPLPHGRELAIRTPRGDFMYLSFIPGGPVDLPDHEAIDIVGRDRFSFNPKTLEGWSYRVGGDWSTVFIFPGTYMLVSDDTLQTDAPSEAFAICAIRLEP